MGASDVFKQVEYPVAPGICRTCGVPYGVRILVDTGLTGDFCNRPHWNPITEEVDAEVDINTAGAVYFCESCVVNMGMTFGMVSSEKADQMRLIIADYDKVTEQLQEQILGMEKIINGYSDLGTSNSFNSVTDVPVLPNVPETTDETNSAIDGSGVDSERADSGKSETGESDESEQSGGVSAVNVNESGESRDESDKPAGNSAIGF